MRNIITENKKYKYELSVIGKCCKELREHHLRITQSDVANSMFGKTSKKTLISKFENGVINSAIMLMFYINNGLLDIFYNELSGLNIGDI